MVYFTCQHCGESVNKPRVEKHYFTKCRFKTPYLTCVDCLKDFNGDEYIAHTQCISEAERYSAKGTLFKEPAGKKKQAQYTEVVHSLLNSKTLTCVQKKLLEVCASHDNVPRKLNRFQNFMANVTRHVQHTKRDIEDVFKLLESAWKSETQAQTNISTSQEKQNSDEKTTGDSSSNNCRSTKDETITNNLVESDSTLNNIHESKKIKIKKQKEELQTAVETKMQVDCNNTYEESKENINGLTKKQLKKQKKYEKYLMELQTEAKNEEKNEGEEISCNEEKKAKKKSKKLKKLTKNLENELNNQHIETGKTVEVAEEAKQKKNKKLKACDIVNGTIDEASAEMSKEDRQENCINSNNKNKKKSKKIKGQLTNPELNGNVETDISTAIEMNPKKNKKRKMEETIETDEMKKPRITEDADGNGNQTMFDWTNVILRVLESRPDKELSIKRLGKKVIDEYQTVRSDHRSYEDLLAKFNKKVKKTKGVRVIKDKAKLIE